MSKDIILTVILYSTVELMLLISTNRLLAKPIHRLKMVLSVLFGCLYCTLCLCTPIALIRSSLGRLVSLGIMAWLAFGRNWRCGAVFVLLSLALVGIVPNTQSVWFTILGAVIIASLSAIGFRNVYKDRYVPVILRHNEQCVALTALLDTGNTLRDPITGNPVMVVSADIAQGLVGLSREELVAPTRAIEHLPGSRLIPFHSVGCDDGLLLAMRMRDVTVGSWRGSCLVAFAPKGLGTMDFQALIGGMF